MHTDPYQPPTTTSQQSAQQDSLDPSSVLSSILIFVIVAVSSFFQLVLTFFGDSTEFWPVFVCGGIAIVIGITVAYLAKAARILQRLGTASLLAVGATSLLITVALLSYKQSPDGLATLLPPSVSNMAPGQVILITASLLGSTCGLWGCVYGGRTGRVLAMIVGGGSGIICTSYLVAVVMLLVSP